MHWNRWIRQIHRWLSVAFVVVVVFNGFVVAEKKYTNFDGLLAVVPLALLLLTGLYVFFLPYAGKWRKRRGTG